MLLFWVIRRFPQRWWLVFWGFSIPIVLFGIFAAPYINLLFDKFEPLQLHNPELVARLEQVVEKGHMNIPPERMFLMKASEKVTTLNAYVTGFGASKRVVVWDTSLQKGTPDEVLFIFGHESGHYVLGHIVYGVFFSILTLLLSALSRVSLRSRSDLEVWAALEGACAGGLGRTCCAMLLAFSIFSADRRADTSQLQPSRRARCRCVRAGGDSRPGRRPADCCQGGVRCSGCQLAVRSQSEPAL